MDGHELVVAIVALKAFVKSAWERSTRPKNSLVLNPSELEQLDELNTRVCGLAHRFGLTIPPFEEQAGPVYHPGTRIPMIQYTGGRMCYPSPDWLRSMDVLLARAEQIGQAGSDVVGAADPAAKNTPAIRRLLTLFTNGQVDERFDRAENVLQDDTLTTHAKLTKIDAALPFPPTASAEQLGLLLDVSKQAVLKTDWWKKNRKGEKASEIGRRQGKHLERKKEHDTNRPTDDEG